MSVKLNTRAFGHARTLVDEGRFVADQRDDWSEHQPSAEQENEFIRRHGWAEYGRWHLGLDDTAKEETKGHYKFPYGDFRDVHRCGLLAAESRAGKYKYFDIERATHQLHEMIDAHAHGASHTR
jgi:hypothetical protein